MSQFRKDPVSGEWILIATERGSKHVRDFGIENGPRKIVPKDNCPFEDPENTGNWPPVLTYEEKGRWEMIIIPNKFPALFHGNKCPLAAQLNGYAMMDGYGYHELLIARDHEKNFGALSPKHALQAFKMFAERYRSIDKDKCMAYLSIFGNWGPSAGASMFHPHYQLMALPVMPPMVARSYEGSERYYKKHKKCVHCEMMRTEKKEMKRIIAENDEAIAIAPFVSHSPFEVRIFPKKHISAFENSPHDVLKDTSALLQKMIQKIKKKLNDPDFNFYIHTAPLRGQKRTEHYHWHIELLPKMSRPAGFELATHIDVNVVDPDVTAKTLR